MIPRLIIRALKPKPDPLHDRYWEALLERQHNPEHVGIDIKVLWGHCLGILCEGKLYSFCHVGNRNFDQLPCSERASSPQCNNEQALSHVRPARIPSG